ncbi:WEB family protein At1g75720-like [Pistacia vera]|uniref:WEB family protein At1g75720-like n=1 Tax=Pistacia vera TaxID=55513 RepID=UPI001263922F|nr:WEB family protein At1g75720-like [Pistacia vera]
MEPQTLALSLNPIHKNYSSNVDTSRPFRSVKEAVAVFGERFLVGEIYSPKRFSFSPPTKHEIITPWKYSSSPQNPREVIDDEKNEKNNNGEVLDTLKKLEAELEETKMELKLLKKREAETEVALATLNAELHKNMSKLAEAEADVAKKAIEYHRRREDQERKRELVRKKENSLTLAQILCVEENDIDVEAHAARFLGGRRSEGKMMKKKPIVPLVTDLFFKKKGSPNNSTILHSTIYASPNMYFS